MTHLRGKRTYTVAMTMEQGGRCPVEHPYWTELLKDVVPGRVEKPRISGLTMVIDGGIPAVMMRGLFELAAEHIDYWKLGYGSSSVCPAERIQDKISLCQEYDVLAYPGGTSFEIAYAQGVWKEYLNAVFASGIRVVEISDGTVHLPVRVRREVIQYAHRLGLTVLAEIGKKSEQTRIPLSEQLSLMKGDLQNGADYVIVEARESGRGVGVYDAEGHVREQDVDFLTEGMGPLATRMIWEAPLTSQQVYHIRKNGHKANLGNIHPWDVLSVESLRRGLRSDTMALQLNMLPGTPEEPAGEGTEDGEGTENKPTLWVDPSKRGVRKHRHSD